MKTEQPMIDWELELPLHREWMLGVAYSRVGESHAADDIVQDIVLSVVRQNPKLDDPGKARGWLYQAVVRRVADHFRRQYRHEQAIDRLSESCQEHGVETAAAWMQATEQKDMLAVAIQSLEEQDRELVLLKFTENWSYRQLAEKFGLAERTVEYLLVRAKQKLRAEILKLHGDEYE